MGGAGARTLEPRPCARRAWLPDLANRTVHVLLIKLRTCPCVS